MAIVVLKLPNVKRKTEGDSAISRINEERRE